ncbi:MAG: LysR family transcriptional regulator [Myxococcota bacterium]
MERLRRIAGFWSWLPTFRAVAETEHLPSASEALHVTPSALSRTIRLLEDQLGTKLFERQGRRIVLSPAGDAFLGSVRDAMRLIDEGVTTLQGRTHVGPVRVSVPGPLAPLFVLPALRRVQAEHPAITGWVTGHVASAVHGMLLRGALDLALLDDPIPAPDLHVEPLAVIRHGVYCGRAHPLYGKTQVPPDELARWAFVAPIPDGDGVTHDAWPPEHERRVTLRVIQMQVAIRACAEGELLAALPELVAADHGGELWRLDAPFMRPSQLYLMQRRELAARGRIGVVVDALRAVAAERGSPASEGGAFKDSAGLR